MASGSFTRSQLLRRGWTHSLIDTLLPPGDAWPRRQVYAAETKPAFTSDLARRREEEDTAYVTAQLQESFNRTRRRDSLAWRLAGHCHEAICHPRPGFLMQASAQDTRRHLAYLQEFLSFEAKPENAPQDALLRLQLSFAVLADGTDRDLTRRIFSRYPLILHALATHAVQTLLTTQPRNEIEKYLRQADFPVRELLTASGESVYTTVYVPQAIGNSLALLMALHPKDEYPQARRIRRHFILHLGGTNTGKTHDALAALMRARDGIYLAPLRLLALEAQETLIDHGVNCSLLTGEEEDIREQDSHIAATAEKLPVHRRFSMAVVDECQMIADPLRGSAWTRAILGLRAPEIHLCAAPEAKELLQSLIETCGDTHEIVLHRRKTPLEVLQHNVDIESIEPGDALITFSRRGVLTLAEQLRQAGQEAAIIYGALPYHTRRMQMEGFLDGHLRYVVATDAIGMGLNLPIRRVIFTELEKYDGLTFRSLKPEEIQQIAGRAGRYGMYRRGYVGATEDTYRVAMAMETVIPPLRTAILGFSDLVLKVNFDLLQVLTTWSRMPCPAPFRKLDISRYLFLIQGMRQRGFHLSGAEELRCANIPFDEREPALLKLFFHYLKSHLDGQGVTMPTRPAGSTQLHALELYYRQLDLYYAFARAFRYEVDLDRLYDLREDLAEEIHELLRHRLRENLNTCARCGCPLPAHTRHTLCAKCAAESESAHFPESFFS